MRWWRGLMLFDKYVKNRYCAYIFIFTHTSMKIYLHMYAYMHRYQIDSDKVPRIDATFSSISRVKRSHLDIHPSAPTLVESRPWMMGSWKFLHRSCLVCTRRSLEDLSISWTRLLEEHGGNVGRRSCTGSTKTKRWLLGIYILVTFHCDVVFTYACTNVRSNLYRYIH